MMNVMTNTGWSLADLRMELTGWTNWAVVLVTFLLLWSFARMKRNVKKHNPPPGPPTWRIIGTIITRLIDSTGPQHRVIYDLAKIYGPIMLLQMGEAKFVFVSDPEIAMEILKTKDHLFADRAQEMPSVKYLTYGGVSISQSDSGDYHSFVRKLLITELLIPKKLEAFQALRTAEQDMVIRECFKKTLHEESIDLQGQFKSMALRVISQLAFGTKWYGTESKSHDEWSHLVPEFTECLTLLLAETFHSSLKWVDTLTGNRRRMQKTFKRIDTLLQEILEDHTRILDALNPEELEAYEAKDFMDIMLLHRNGEHGKFVSDTHVKAVSLDLVLAGSDTTVSTAEWAMAELLINPHTMKRFQEEVDSVVGKDRFVTEADVGKMPYLHAIIKETFRLHPPIPNLVPHTNRADCKVGGYDIAANSSILVDIYSMSHSTSRWNDPFKFDPARFLVNSEPVAINVNGSYPELMPFGRGRRQCPGIGFAHTLLYGLLASLVHAFDWSLPDGQTASSVDMVERPGFVSGMLTPLIGVPKPRLASHVYKLL